MRLPEVEEQLHQLAQRRWGSDVPVRAELDEESGRLRIGLCDTIELIGRVPEPGSVVNQACRLLGQYLEQVEPWVLSELPPSSRFGKQQ